MAEPRRALGFTFAGIHRGWQTYYFTWLDGSSQKIEKQARISKGTDFPPHKSWDGQQAAVSTPSKNKSPTCASRLETGSTGFRWEELMTWWPGVILIVLVYYLGDGLVDPGRCRHFENKTGMPSVWHPLSPGWDSFMIWAGGAIRQAGKITNGAFAGFWSGVTQAEGVGIETQGSAGRAGRPATWERILAPS